MMFYQLIDGGEPAPGVTYQTVMGEKTGYTLGEMVFQDDSIPLTVGGLLKDCADNKAAWQAFYLENLIDIDTLTDFNSVSCCLDSDFLMLYLCLTSVLVYLSIACDR